MPDTVPTDPAQPSRDTSSGVLLSRFSPVHRLCDLCGDGHVLAARTVCGLPVLAGKSFVVTDLQVQVHKLSRCGSCYPVRAS